MYRFGILSVLAIVTLAPATASAYDTEDFVGTWEGEYTSTTFGGSQFPMTLDLQIDGFYTDSSGYLMPPYYYPDTQSWNFDAATNRLHFQYLSTVYAGMRFYDHFYYEVVSFTGNEMVLHYNYWDDPEPHPQAGAIVLQRSGQSAVTGHGPVNVSLATQSFPNPFNPRTTISFDLPANAFVTLEIYDTRGRTVATLIRREMEAGEHRVPWSADGLAGGIYLYRVTAGETAGTGKLLLLK